MPSNVPTSTDPIPDDERNPLVPPEHSYRSLACGQRSKKKTEGPRITHIVIHIVGGKDDKYFESAYWRFYTAAKDPTYKNKASSHYIITQAATICQFVPDEMKAWHAGIFPLERKAYDGGRDNWLRWLCIDGDVPPVEPATHEQITQDGKKYLVRPPGERWRDFDYWLQRHGDRQQPINFEVKPDPNDYSIGIELCHEGSNTRDLSFEDGLYDGLDRLLSNLCATHGIPRTREFIVGHEDVNPIARAGWDPGRGFDWKRVCPSKRYYFPLSHFGESPPPISQYVNNEDPSTGFSGAYALSLHRTLHGGIHLFASDPGNTPVRCMAPGYVVAVRLPGPKTAATAPAVLNTTNNWTGFVLLRHEFEDAKHKDGGKPKVLTLYSLYMHLASPNYENIEADPYLLPASAGSSDPAVPWFADVFKKRFGSWIRVGPQTKGAPPPGTIAWSAEPYSPGKASYGVYDLQEPIVPEKDGQVEWVFRGPPIHYAKVMKALQEGHVVTFPEPFVCFTKAGEPVGLLRPFSGSGAPQPAFMHWETFAPVKDGKSAIRDILQLAKETIPELESAFDNNELSEIDDNNFLEPNELRNKVLPVLSESERRFLEPGISLLEAKDNGFNYAAYRTGLQRMLADPETFAPQQEHDGRPDYKDKYPGRFTYPLTLEIESDFLPSPDHNADTNQPYELTVSYFSTPTPGAGDALLVDTIKLDTGKYKQREITDPVEGTKKVLQLTLKAPAQAQSLKLESPSGAVSFCPPVRTHIDDGALLLKRMLPHRWRRVLLSHLNEWSPEPVAKLFNALKKREIIPSSFKIEDVLPLAWWHEGGVKAVLRAALTDVHLGAAEAVAAIGVGKKDGGAGPDQEETVVPVDTKETSLFGTTQDQLPINAKIEALHPVTLTWLLDILFKRGALGPRSSWDVKLFHREVDPPFAWGWTGSATPALGDTVSFMVVSPDYGYDKTRVAVVHATIGGRKLRLWSAPYAPNGFVFKDQVIDCWGDCQLSVEGAGSAPKVVLGKTVLSIPEPQLETVTPEERQSGAFRTFETSTLYVVPVKLKPTSPMPRRVPGGLGIQLSRDGGKSWQDARLNGERIFMPAWAKSTPAGKDQVAISTEDFVIERETVIGRTPQGRAKKKLHLTDTIGYDDLRHAQNMTGIGLSVSMAIAMQRLRDLFKRPINIIELERSGKRCVIAARVPAMNSELAQRALEVFPKVRLPGATPLDQTSACSPAIADQIAKSGLEVLLDTLEPIAVLTAKPGYPKLHPVKVSQDGLFILIPDAVKNPNRMVTDHLAWSAYEGASGICVSLGLVRALDALLRAAKPRLLEIDAAGRCCTVEGKQAAATAHDTHLFAEVHDDVAKKHVLLVAAQQGTYFASADVQPALNALYADEMAKGHGSTAFRLYFVPINGLSSVPRGRDCPPYYRESELANLPGGSPPVPSLSSTEAVGTLRPLAFGDVTIRLIEAQAHLACQLSGNRVAWAPFNVKITVPPNTKPKTIEVQGGDQLIEAQFPAPKAGVSQYDLEAILKRGIEGPEYTAPNKKSYSQDFTPRLLPTEGPGLKIEPLGDHLLVWCRCQGIESPAQGNPSLEQARLGTAAKLSIVPRTAAHDLVLEVGPQPLAQPPTRLEPHQVKYLISSGKGSGYINHDGVFCALVKLSGHPTPGTVFTFTLKRRGNQPIRGTPVTPLTGSYVYSGV